MKYLIHQEWLKLPCASWSEVEEYRTLEELGRNIAVVNDIAERVNIKTILVCFALSNIFYHTFPINC